MFLVTLSHRETTLAGEECSLAPEKVLALARSPERGQGGEGRCEQVAAAAAARETFHWVLTWYRLLSQAPFWVLPQLKEAGWGP